MKVRAKKKRNIDVTETFRLLKAGQFVSFPLSSVDENYIRNTATRLKKEGYEFSVTKINKKEVIVKCHKTKEKKIISKINNDDSQS